MRIRALAACLFWTGLCGTFTAQAHAEEPQAALAPERAPLQLVVSAGESKLQPEAIRRAIELELKRPVALAPGSGTEAPELAVVVHADHTVTVSYTAVGGPTRTRSVGLPQDDAQSAEVIALLSDNLSRNEAEEVLAGLSDQGEASTGRAPTEASEEPASKQAPSKPELPKPVEAAPKNSPRSASPSALLTTPYPLFNLTLAHPIGLLPSSERLVLNGELGLIYSHVGELRGAGVDVMVLRTERDVHGFSYASFYNRTGGSVYGVTSAAFVARSLDVQGVAVSGIANFDRDLQGWVIAGIANHTRNGRGVQVAGVANIAAQFRGLQLAGTTNIADEIKGAQIGVVNVAGEVKGLQLGVVNVAKHVDGTAIGLASIAGNGRVQALFWASTFMPFNAAAKFTVGPFYTQVGGGYAPDNRTYVYELGLGVHLPFKRWFVEPGVHYTERRQTQQAFSQELSEHLHYRVLVGWDRRAVSPFLGAAVVQRVAHAANAPESATVSVEGFAGLALF